MSFLVAEDIVKQFANHLALDKVSLSVPRGKIFGLLGPNGAGKTTLIRIINQITAPDTGLVTIDGKPLIPAHVANIGYLPEERGLYKKMKIGEQALYLAQLKGMRKADAMKKLKYWFEKFGIQEWWGKKVEELSKGMQQKVQFIVTILHEPELLIFDEPFSGFDPINANLLKREILDLKERGATIIFSTHNMGSVEELCDNIALINKSKKILDGSISEIRESYKSHIFQLHFKKTADKFAPILTDKFELIDIDDSATDIAKLRLRLKKDTSTNEMLTELMSNGEILSFREELPSMNDIFIRVVEESGETVDEEVLAS